jgi:tRNA A37 threonylcarbamoyladenosine synthetase subunit TsaC/SUA5/YrdC
VCKSLAQSSSFAKLSNDAHRLIKSLTPGPLSYSSKHEVKVIRRRETTDDIFSSYSFTAFEQGAPTA